MSNELELLKQENKELKIAVGLSTRLLLRMLAETETGYLGLSESTKIEAEKYRR